MRSNSSVLVYFILNRLIKTNFKTFLRATKEARSLFLVSSTLLTISEIFPKSVHIIEMPALYLLMSMVCGREGSGVEFKVHLMSR